MDNKRDQRHVLKNKITGYPGAGEGEELTDCITHQLYYSIRKVKLALDHLTFLSSTQLFHILG